MRVCGTVVLLLGMLPITSGGIVSPTVKQVTRLDAPKPWVGTEDVYINATTNTDLVEGTLALGGRFALVLRDDTLPRLAQTKPQFTIAMSLFITTDPTHDEHVGIFWKGFGNDDRTPSAWLVPGSTFVTFRVSTQTSTEVWGTSNKELPIRRWTHIAFSLENRIMRFYVDGLLDSAVETPDDVVTNSGNLHLGKDPNNPGFQGFIADVKMHSFALADEDVQQVAAHALHKAPDFNGEPERDAIRLLATQPEVERREAAHFRNVMDGGETTSETASNGDSVGSVDEDSVDSNVDSAPDSVDTALDTVATSTDSTAEALDTDHLFEYAAEQFALGDEKRKDALALLDSSRGRSREKLAERGFEMAMTHLSIAAAAGHNQARLSYAAMLEHGYGTKRKKETSNKNKNVLSRPGRALYHRLLAAAAGDPMARLTMGAATVVGSHVWMDENKIDWQDDMGYLSSLSSNPPSSLSNSRCPLALHYFYHAATAAYEEAGLPGGQVRVEKGRLHENTRRARGDLAGETDDRVLYLSRAADLGDGRAMLAMGNSYYWGHFGLELDHQRALQFYRRAHHAGELRGTVGVAKMVLKGEGGLRNTTEALEYYTNAAERGASDALNGLGYLYFYGEDWDERTGDTGDTGDAGDTKPTRIRKNDTAALEYFNRAADLGNGDGLVNAGMMLRAGLGAPVDIQKAHALFKKCADAPGEHNACSYQAALIEASGEGGVERDCELAVKRLRSVAESGRWMTPLGEGMKAHLANKQNLAAWEYEFAAASSTPAANFNAAWLHEQMARDLRVGRRFVGGGYTYQDSEGFADDSINKGTIGDSSDDFSSSSSLLSFLREARSANALRRHAVRVLVDSDADDAMRAWSAISLADCLYYGEERPGGCAKKQLTKAFRLYRSAKGFAQSAIGYSEPQPSNATKEQIEASARASQDQGGVLDARRLMTTALTSEAWMLFHGEGCLEADANAAKLLLREAISISGWRELLATAPLSLALHFLEVLNQVCEGLTGSTDCGFTSVHMFWKRQPRLVIQKQRQMHSETRVYSADASDKLTMAAFSVRFVDDVVELFHGIEDSIHDFGNTYRFTLTVVWSILTACVGFAVGWRVVVRPMCNVLYGEARNNFENAQNNAGRFESIRGVRGGGVIGELRQRIERMRVEAEREAQARRALHGEESDEETDTETNDFNFGFGGSRGEERTMMDGSSPRQTDESQRRDETSIRREVFLDELVREQGSNDSFANTTNTTVVSQGVGVVETLEAVETDATEGAETQT